MSENKKSITTVILSGGSGARLWPVSRLSHPKPFMKLADGQTLIQKTYLRAKTLSTDILTVTNRDYYFMSRDVLELVNIPSTFLLEPVSRNTAPAIALAAKMIESTKGSEATVLVLAADHLIHDQFNFASAVAKASKLAEQDYLVTFGIVPTAPETGFGYIERGESLELGDRVARFVEKPDVEMAKNFISSGKYLWNSGILCFKAGLLLDELDKHAPEVSKSLNTCWAEIHSLQDAQMVEIKAKDFTSVPDISIDYAVMERSDKVAVIPSDFGWSDIGSWNSIRDLVEPDASLNRAVGEVIFIDSSNTFVQSENRLVATVGINDLMIIDTPDALLVTHQEKSQNVKKVVALLKEKSHETFTHHRKVVRPWGAYTVLEEGSGFKIKRIEVKAGASLSLQMHHHRSEHWVVVSGTAKIINGDNEMVVQANESTYIPAGQKHRLENPGIIPCVMIEVQCGTYLGEDDIVRFEDKYGR